MQFSKAVGPAVLGAALLLSGVSHAQWDLSDAGAGTKSFVDPAGQFSLRIPAGWQTSIKNGVPVLQWDQSAVTMLDRPGQTDTDKALQSATETIRETGTDYKQGEPTASSLSKWNGRTILFSATGPNGVPARGRVVALSNGHDGLVVILTSPTASFDTDDSVFSNALATLDMLPSKSGEKILLAEKTPVHLLLGQDLKSGRDRKGTTVHFRVGADVVSPDGQVLIGMGATATGTVLRSDKRRMFGKPGKLDIGVQSATAVDGSVVPLRAMEKISERGNNNAGAVTVGALLLTPLALFVHGRDVTMKAGTEITVYVDQGVMVAGVPVSQVADLAAQAPAPDDAAPAAVAAP